jgi:AraC-like DNA-binding protein
MTEARAHVRARPPLTVLVVMRDMEWRSHVRTVLARCGTLAFTDDVRRLAGLAEQEAPDVVLWHLDGLADSAEPYVTIFGHLRRIAPWTTVVAYADMGRAATTSLLLAGRVGVDRVVLRGYDDLEWSVHDVRRSSHAEAAIQELLRHLNVTLGPVAITVTRCVRQACVGPLTVSQLAQDLEVDRKTVGLWLRRADLPPPQKFIGWCRVYGVAQLLAHPERSVAQVARIMRFSSESDLRRMVMRYAGCTPSQLRARDGVALLLSRLHRGSADSRRAITAPVA